VSRQGEAVRDSDIQARLAVAAGEITAPTVDAIVTAGDAERYRRRSGRSAQKNEDEHG
jgi:hypothetical protein